MNKCASEIEEYILEEVKSGETEEVLWVSLGFRSELEQLDVLHVVCAKTVDSQDRKNGHVSIYLERFDQAYSCYSGASAIEHRKDCVIVDFTEHGAEKLDFAPRLLLSVSSRVGGYTDARDVMGKMAFLECGSVVAEA